ncbi:MAG: flavodoxin domain-containing protein, partial [Gammaproteobacteria bacterium]
MTLPAVPDTGIKDADRELIRGLARSLTAEQALWVSGYFAGAAEARGEWMALTGEASTVISRARSGQSPVGLLKILFASESGNAAALAKEIESRAQGVGIRASVEDLARYKTRGLADEETVLFIASTHGEGEPPETAASFFEFLSSRKAPSLERLRFAVLALGDSTYEFFCEAGKVLDRRLEELGGVRLLDRCDCDVDYEIDAQAWAERALARLQADAAAAAAAVPPRPSSAGMPAAAGLPAAFSLALGEAKPLARPYGKSNPFTAQILGSIGLTGRGSSKATRHLELSLAEAQLDYLPGDALGVVPQNDPALVGELAACFGWSGTEKVAGRDGEVTIGQA